MDIKREKLTEHKMYKDVLLKLWTMKTKDEKQAIISKFIENATPIKNKDGSFDIDKVMIVMEFPMNNGQENDYNNNERYLENF